MIEPFFSALHIYTESDLNDEKIHEYIACVISKIRKGSFKITLHKRENE